MTSQFQSLYSLKNTNGICNYADICFKKSLLKGIELNFVWSYVCSRMSHDKILICLKTREAAACKLRGPVSYHVCI